MEESHEEFRYLDTSNMEYEKVHVKDASEMFPNKQGTQIVLASSATAAHDSGVRCAGKNNLDHTTTTQGSVASCNVYRLIVLVMFFSVVSIAALSLSLLIIIGVAGPKNAVEIKGTC